MSSICDVLDGPYVASFGANSSDTSQKNVWEYLVNDAIVYDRITSASLSNFALLSELLDHFKSRREEVEAHNKAFFPGPRGTFVREKLLGISKSIEILTTTLGGSVPNPGFQQSLQTNIFEAVKLDAKTGHDNNSRVGVALASTIKFGPSVDSHQFMYRLGKEWVDAYIAWNTAFVIGALPVSKMVKLLIPSVTCSASQSVQGEAFIAARIISLSLALYELAALPDQVYTSLSIDSKKLDDINAFLLSEWDNVDFNTELRYPLVEAMGQSNLQHSILTSPSVTEVEEMLYKLCGNHCHNGSWRVTDTVPIALLDDEDFQVYVALVLWMTALLAGLGCELLFWFKLIDQGGWSEEQESLWWVAQFFFPLWASTCLGLALQKNYLALPFLVFGLFKFGMPETLSYMYTALYQQSKSTLARIGDFLNSTGTVLHHSSAILLITLLLSGVVPPSRHIVAPILLLTMQHWFVLVKYMNFWAYAALEIVLEIWFEWVLLSEFQYLHSVHWTLLVAGLGMLVAHWIYLAAATLELLALQSGRDWDTPKKDEMFLDDITTAVEATSQAVVSNLKKGEGTCKRKNGVASVSFDSKAKSWSDDVQIHCESETRPTLASGSRRMLLGKTGSSKRLLSVKENGSNLRERFAVSSALSCRDFISTAQIATLVHSQDKEKQESAQHKPTASSSDDLGHRIDIAHCDNSGDNSSSVKERMWFVVVSLFLVFVLLNALLVFIVVLVIKNYPDYNNEKFFSDFDNPYNDILKDTIPYIQNWYRNLDHTQPLLSEGGI
jgi:uncharacterized protein YjeT (DUF2065 family)